MRLRFVFDWIDGSQGTQSVAVLGVPVTDAGAEFVGFRVKFTATGGLATDVGVTLLVNDGVTFAAKSGSTWVAEDHSEAIMMLSTPTVVADPLSAGVSGLAAAIAFGGEGVAPPMSMTVEIEWLYRSVLASELDASQVTTGTFAVGRLASGTPDGTKFIRDDGVLAVPAAGGEIWRVEFAPLAFTTHATWGTVASSGDYWYATALTGGGSIGNYVEFVGVFSAGTWDADLLYAGGTDRGAVTVKIDGVVVGSVDMYHVSVTKIKATIPGITLATEGKKTVRLEVTGKHASSSSYYTNLSHLVFRRTT